MTNIERIERDIQSLTPAEYAELRDWFIAREEAVWDAEIEADIKAGKLDALGEAARRLATKPNPHTAR